MAHALFPLPPPRGAPLSPAPRFSATPHQPTTPSDQPSLRKMADIKSSPSPEWTSTRFFTAPAQSTYDTPHTHTQNRDIYTPLWTFSTKSRRGLDPQADLAPQSFDPPINRWAPNSSETRPSQTQQIPPHNTTLSVMSRPPLNSHFQHRPVVFHSQRVFVFFRSFHNPCKNIPQKKEGGGEGFFHNLPRPVFP